jgi:hypothetical protein
MRLASGVRAWGVGREEDRGRRQTVKAEIEARGIAEGARTWDEDRG